MQKNNNTSIALKGNKKQSFAEWAKENSAYIHSSLITEGINFINDNAENLKAPVIDLILDDRWHYIDKAKKQSYRGEVTYNSDGIAHLNLTYYTFRHGGQSERFSSKEVIKALWLSSRNDSSFKLTLKPNKKTKQPVEKQIKNEAIDWLTHDFEIWKSCLSTLNNTTNTYLKRKRLTNIAIPGIRVGFDKLPDALLKKGLKPKKREIVAVKITDVEDNYHGLQKINTLGEKRFTKGLGKKGNFALIGEYSVPEKLERVHVCEGIATAASIFLATGEPVFAALDAFNILPVCKNLKKHYKKTPLQIWADNDWQKANKPLKEGRVLGNTGLIHANRTAFKLRNTTVCTPDFTHLNEKDKQKATDFNDLYVFDGLHAVINTTPMLPDIELALWHELIAYNKRAHGVISPNQFKQGKKTTYNSRYLPDNLFEQEGVHLVRSAIGTGKTEVVEKLIKKHPKKSVLFTTHLISLVESAANRLNLVSYNECDTYDLQIEHRVAICLNSLGKLTAVGALRHYDIVVIDEIEQVLARLTTKIEQKPLLFSVLKHIIENAKQLICLDAHLSNTTVELIKRFCPDKSIAVHFNTYEPGTQREIKLHESVENIQIAAIKALNANKTVYLAFNAKKEAYKTYSAIKTAFPDKKGLYISSDSTGEAENRAFFNDVNKISKQYDYLICTPSVSTGVSIDNSHFDFVGGVFNAQVNTANDCMQALGRVRNHKTLHVYCEKRIAFKPINPDVIAAKWSVTHAHDLNLMSLTDTGNQILLNPDYEKLTLLVTQARNRSFNDFYEQFCLLALHDGMKVGYASESIDTTLKKHLKDFKLACVEQEDIANKALELSAVELKKLANKPRKTLAETTSYKKQQVVEFYNLNANDSENITALMQADNEGRFRKQVLNLELALGDEQTAKVRFLSQLDNGAQFAADLTHFATLQQLLQVLLKTLHLDTTSGLLSTEDYQYDADSLLASPLFKFIEANRAVLQGVITLPTPMQLKNHPLRFLSSLLAKIGLKQKRVGKSEKGVYHLDIERIDVLNALIARRASSSGISMPIDATTIATKKQTGIEKLIEGLAKIKAFLTPKPQLAPIPI